MAFRVDLTGLSGSYYDVRLRRLLELLVPFEDGLHWRVHEWEGVWHPTIRDPDHVLDPLLTTTELQRLGDEMDQIWWGYFFGAPSGTPLPDSPRDSARIAASTIAIEAFDSSSWRIWSRDDTQLARLAAEFKILRTERGEIKPP